MEITRNPDNGKFRFASMSEEEYMELSDDGGICLSCDDTQTSVEPDARCIPCSSCDKPFVYGMAQLLLMGRIRFTAEAKDAQGSSKTGATHMLPAATAPQR